MPRNSRNPLYFIVIVTISLIVLVIVSSFPGNFINQLSSPFSVILERSRKCPYCDGSDSNRFCRRF